MRSRSTVLAGLALLVTSLFALWLYWHYPSYERLRQQGDAMVAEIERFKAQRGRYPRSFGEAGIRPPHHAYSPWEYRSSSNANFGLSVGEYGQDGFVFFYQGKGQWSLDD
jgi:hypothetical protein